MVSRRILIKSLGILSGTAVLPGLPLTKAAAQSVTSGIHNKFSKKQRLVVVGNLQQHQPFIKYALLHPEKIEVVSIIGASTENIPPINIAPELHFNDFEQFLQSGTPADVVLLSGQKDELTTLRAVKAGYHVWSDRPIAFTPLACKKVNNTASGYFCKVHIAYVINDGICLMDNKIYSARV